MYGLPYGENTFDLRWHQKVEGQTLNNFEVKYLKNGKR